MKFFPFILCGGAILFVMWNMSGDSTRPQVRNGPGSSKFVSVNPPKEDGSGWHFPTWSEVIVTFSYYLGGDQDSDFKQGGPKEMHRRMTAQIEQGLELARESGIATGPTMFDPHIDRTVEPAAGMPRKNPNYGGE